MADSRQKDAFTGAHPENIRRRKIITVISLILILILFSMIAYFVGRPLMKQLRDSPETFRDYVYSHRLLGPFLMVGIMMLQVIIAIIPGGPCELAAGFVFGWLEGAVLCLIGSILASALVFLAVRKWGVKLVELFFPREKILSYSFLQNEKKLNLLSFVLFLVPGTPKDMLTYILGLTPMKLTSMLVITTLARLPAVLCSTITGSLAQKGSYIVAIITYGVTMVIAGVCVWWYRKISRQEKEQKANEK